MVGCMLIIIFFFIKLFYFHKAFDAPISKHIHSKPKVFALGLSKTGTTTLNAELENILNTTCCHWRCAPKNEIWSKFKKREDLLYYDCYTDPGTKVDFKLLHAWFPNAIFLMTTRHAKVWVASMHRHIAGNRLQLGCSVHGTNKDCEWKGDVNNRWRDNSDLRKVVGGFMNYYKSFRAYFANDEQHMGLLPLEEYGATWRRVFKKVFETSLPLTNVKKSYSNEMKFKRYNMSVKQGEHTIDFFKKKAKGMWTREFPEIFEEDMNMVPQALIVGFQKAGTTALSRTLQKHPEMSVYKHEIHYFDNRRGKPPTNLSVYNYIHHLKKYISKYNMTQPDRKRGLVLDKTPAYIKYPYRIRSVLPSSTKIIILLREPVDRIYSAFLHAARTRAKKTGKFVDQKWNNMNCTILNTCRSIVKLGQYMHFLDNWTSTFDNVFIGIYEHMWKPNYDWTKLQHFLELRSPIVPITHKVNFRTTKTPMPTYIQTNLTRFYQPYNRKLCSWLEEHRYTCPAWAK